MPAGHDISSSVDAIRVRALEVDAAANATTTGVEITGLQLDSVEPGIYMAEWFIRYQSAATTTGVKFGINHTGTVTSFMACCQVPTTGTTAVTQTHDQATTTTLTILGVVAVRSLATTAPNMGPWTDVDTADADLFARIYAVLTVTATGALELWHASEVAASSTVKAGSCVRLTKCA